MLLHLSDVAVLLSPVDSVVLKRNLHVAIVDVTSKWKIEVGGIE